jgi:hypothetical protein
VRLQNHYKLRAKEAVAAAAAAEADGAAERETSRSAAAAAAEEEVEMLTAELAAVRARAAVEADRARHELVEARGRLAAADEARCVSGWGWGVRLGRRAWPRPPRSCLPAAADPPDVLGTRWRARREAAVREAVDAAAAEWQQRLDAARREADEAVAGLQDDVVRLRSAAEASLRSAAEDVSRRACAPEIKGRGVRGGPVFARASAGGTPLASDAPPQCLQRAPRPPLAAPPLSPRPPPPHPPPPPPPPPRAARGGGGPPPPPQHFAAEMASLNKAKIQVQRECEALRDMAAQVGAGGPGGPWAGTGGASLLLPGSQARPRPAPARVCAPGRPQEAPLVWFLPTPPPPPACVPTPPPTPQIGAGGGGAP